MGDMIVVRYADDIIVGFEHETDARPLSPQIDDVVHVDVGKHR